MSPEQAKGQATGPASDIFNLGLILYAILTGTPAFQEVGLGGSDPLKAVRDTDRVAASPPRSTPAACARGHLPESFGGSA